MNLMRGDCLERMREIPDGSVDMILCDLPYGTTQCTWDNIIPIESLWGHYIRVLKKNGAVVLFGAEPFASHLRLSNLAWYKYDWVWKKSQAVGHLNAWRQPMRNTETISVFYRAQPTYNPKLVDKNPAYIRPHTARTKTSDNYGDHKLDVHKCPNDKSMPATIIEFNNAQGTQHPTQKPVALCEYLIRTYTNEGETVLDNTMGSGTTGVACVNTSRHFIGIEMDDNYFDIAQMRIAQAMAGIS